MFQKAIKRNAKLRLALCGPAGSGKSYSALAIASGLSDKIAAVDTEQGSLSKYADLFSFDVVQPAIFDPRELVKTIKAAEAAGYELCLIDSLSHYWMGKGGELDLVDAVAKKSASNNSFAAWKTITPFHNELIETIIRAKMHIICTMRTKTEWVLEKDERTGKSAPRKVGLAPVMRDGIEFEFDVCGDLDQDNNLIITKSRCPELSGKVINRPGPEMAQVLNVWLAGAPVEEPQPVGPATLENVPTAKRDISGSAEQQATVGAAKVQAISEGKETKPWNTVAEFKAIMKGLHDQLGEELFTEALRDTCGVETFADVKTTADGLNLYHYLTAQLQRLQEAV